MSNKIEDEDEINLFTTSRQDFLYNDFVVIENTVEPQEANLEDCDDNNQDRKSDLNVYMVNQLQMHTHQKNKPSLLSNKKEVVRVSDYHSVEKSLNKLGRRSTMKKGTKDNRSNTLFSENMSSNFNEEEIRDTCAKKINDNSKDRVTMEQMNSMANNVVKTPRQSNISDFDVHVAIDESQNRKSMLKKSIVRVKKHDRTSHLEQ